MKKEYLSEAFRQLELLNEEDFNLSTTADNSDLKDFLDNDDMSVMSLDVIDPEAETEEDLEDSYTGKVILDCCVCHSKLYKDKEEVQIDEEQDLANTDEECPFCYSNDGFKIIGEVAPYGETEVEPKEDEDIEHEEDDKNNTNESLKSRKNRKLKESYEKEGYYAKIVHDTLIKVGVDYIDIGADQEGDSIIVRVYNETPYTSDDLRKVWLKLHTPEAEDCDISEDEDGDSVMIFEFSLEDEDDDDFEESLKSRKNRKNRRLKESLRGVDAELIADEDDIRDYLSDDDDEDLRIALKHLGDMGTVIDDSIHVTVRFSDGDRITLPKMFFEFYTYESLTTRKTRKNRRLKESTAEKTIYVDAVVYDESESEELLNGIKSKYPSVKAELLDTDNDYNNLKLTGPKDQLINFLLDYMGEEGVEFISDEFPELFDESLNKGRKLKESKHSLKESVTDDYYDIVNSLAEYASEYLKESPDYEKYDAISDALNDNFIYYVDQWTVLQELGESPLEYYTDDVWDALYSDIADKMEVPEEDDETNESLKTRKNRKLKESVKNGYRGSKDIEFVWKGHWSDPELVYDGKTFNYWDIENALWSMFLEENPQWKDSDSDNPECEDEFDKYVQLEGALYLDDVIAGGYFDEPSEKNESVNESEDGRKLFTEYKILVDGRTYEISHTKQRADEIVPILKDMYPDSEIEAKPYKHYASGIERKRLERQIADQLKEYGVNESVNESIQEIEIETDTDKIKIESEPKEKSGETEDILAPVSPETEHQIENNSSDEIDVPIDEFDEETFDELGESFLKNTYENVESYKTESIKEQDGNKLVVEGLITFNSGKVKKTSFIFEAKDITKSGKVRFIGENCQLSRGKKSFTVAGKVQEGKFISESLNYNYRAKDAKSGKSTRMYGTVRTNK